MDEELHNIQLDKPSTWGKVSNEQLAKHTIDSQFEAKPIERSLHLLRKGDDVQKLSVIQALPQLLQCDPNGTLTRVVPKIQQELPKSSCEFHIATSKIFKLLIEKQLPLNLTGAVIQGTESKDPVVSNAWMETLLSVIPLIPLDQVKQSVIPLALAKSQPSSPVYCRVASCKLFGKCSVHPQLQSIDVKAMILPPVQSLCQDCFQDVRATMCSQLHFIAQGLGESVVTTSLLPSLVELASDDNVTVRSAAIASAVLIIPYLNKQTKLETIIPLIKQLCSKTSGGGDATFPTIAREFGKLIEALKNDLEAADCVWLLQFYKTLATKGQTVRINKDNLEVTQDVLCREQCAYNLPSATSFVMCRIPNQLDLWHSVFSGLANDSCYLVRKTTAACVYEIAKILGVQCKVIKDDIVKLLRDDAEEVLHMVVPHVGSTLVLLCTHGVLSRENNVPSCAELTKALLKCQMELSKSFNWRIRSTFLQQLEQLPNCMPSDFIHQHFTPVVLNCIQDARPKPVRSQASRTLLIFLRYNLKEVQRKWIRDNLISNVRNSDSCYTRSVFIMMCRHASEIFSNTYFKKHFFETLLSLADDPISNIRLCVIGLLPSLYKMLVLPEDKKLQTNVDNIFSKLDMVEKDKDVKDILRTKLKEIRSGGAANKQEYMMNQKKKEDEEEKIFQGKLTGMPNRSVSSSKTPSSARINRDKDPGAVSRSQPIIGRGSTSPRVSKAASGTSYQSNASDMSFLEQHFYIDAGVSLPHNNLVHPEPVQRCQMTDDFDKKAKIYDDEEMQTSTVSVESVNLETLSDSELKVLETSTTNITDDVKVNLRKRNKNRNSESSGQRNSKLLNFKYKRYSSVFPEPGPSLSKENNRKLNNRRSLNIGSGDGSRIPICVKKSQSNSEIKNNGEGDADVLIPSISRIRDTVHFNGETNKKTSVINEHGEKQSTSITNSHSAKASGLPVLKRKSLML